MKRRQQKGERKRGEESVIMSDDVYNGGCEATDSHSCLVSFDRRTLK